MDLKENPETVFLRPAAHMDINELLVPSERSANELLVPSEQSVLLSEIPLPRGLHGGFHSQLPASSVFFVSACNLLLPT